MQVLGAVLVFSSALLLNMLAKRVACIEPDEELLH